MAEARIDETPSLSEQYLLPEKEEKPDTTKPVEAKEEVKEAVNTVNPASEEAVAEKSEDSPPVSSEGSTEVTQAHEESSGVSSDAAGGESTEGSPTEENNAEAVAVEVDEPAKEENSDEQEDIEQEPEIKLETAPADFRFPTTNQTRHCFTRYVEYHRCVAAKGEGAQECDKFAKYYRSLCPSEWVERWNEQRENGTFPGPV